MHAMTMYCCYYSCKLIFMQGSCLLLVKNINNWSDFKCKVHHYVYHKFFYSIFEVVKRNTYRGNKKDLLMYVSFKDYKNPLEFSTFEDCNEFVNKWATRHQDFKLKHGAKPITSEFFLFLSSWNFYSHQSLKL